jgi:hypothetical protein
MRVSPGARPIRPVAEVPVDALLARADELARRWVIALILARPLQRLGELPLESLAREAPGLCGQVICALVSDGELERIAPRRGLDGVGRSGWARRLGVLAHARDAPSAVEAVEALRGVLWEALLEELGKPSAQRVAELADRLAYVCASGLAAVVAAASRADLPAADLPAMDLPAAGLPAAFEVGDLAAVPSAAMTSEPRASPAGQRGGVLIDERDEPAAAARDPVIYTRAPAREVDCPPVADADRDAGPQIEIRDERGEEGPAAWIRSIGRQLERFERDRLPFAVLLVELGGVERLRRAALPGGIASLTSQVERLLAQELKLNGGASERGADRPPGSLTCERPGRYWLLVAETDASAARRLAEWLVRTLRPLAARRWPPLEVTVGAAVCPDDGRDAAALAARADVGLYAARTAGRSIAPVDGPP